MVGLTGPHVVPSHGTRDLEPGLPSLQHGGHSHHTEGSAASEARRIERPELELLIWHRGSIRAE
jgi:hypothetical protein